MFAELGGCVRGDLCQHLFASRLSGRVLSKTLRSASPFGQLDRINCVDEFDAPGWPTAKIGLLQSHDDNCNKEFLEGQTVDHYFISLQLINNSFFSH